jgi:co-chaperonin GroES (HSP10)
MKAVGKYIVIKETKNKTTETKGGLILSDKSREDIRYKKAEVLIKGEEVNFIKNKDIIFYDRHAGFSVDIDGKSFKIIKEQDVVIVL